MPGSEVFLGYAEKRPFNLVVGVAANLCDFQQDKSVSGKTLVRNATLGYMRKNVHSSNYNEAYLSNRGVGQQPTARTHLELLLPYAPLSGPNAYEAEVTLGGLGLFAVLLADGATAPYLMTAATMSCTTGAQVAKGAPYPLVMSQLKSAISTSLRPSRFVTESTIDAGVAWVNGGMWCFPGGEHAKFNREKAWRGVADSLAAQIASEYQSWEPEDPTVESIDANNDLWCQKFTVPMPAPKQQTIEMWTVVPKPTGGPIVRFLVSEESVQAATKAAAAAMLAKEEEWAILLRKMTRDGPLSASTLDSKLALSGPLIDPYMTKETFDRIQVWWRHWRDVFGAALDPGNNQPRKDWLWENYLKTHPGTTLTRAAFELNPSLYLPDATWVPMDGKVDSGWWSSIRDGLGWLGGTAASLLGQVDGTLLTGLLGVGAASGWFGKNAQAVVVIGSIAWLMTRGGSRQTVRIVKLE